MSRWARLWRLRSCRSSTMPTRKDVTSMATMAVAKIARKLQELCSGILKRCRVADEETAETGMSLNTMRNTGVRNRRAPEQSPESVDDQPESPTTSGTLTPGTSEGLLDPEGMGTEWRRSMHTLANTRLSSVKIHSSKPPGNVFLLVCQLHCFLELAQRTENDSFTNSATTDSRETQASAPFRFQEQNKRDADTFPYSGRVPRRVSTARGSH